MSDCHPNDAPFVPTRKTELSHLLASTTCSFDGAPRLLCEKPAQHEIALALLGLVSLVAAGRSALEIIVFLGLAALLFAAEALNTTIEILTDHGYSEWSEAA